MASHRVCPWWLGYFLASPLRRWLEDPATIVTPYVCEGMTVLEPGPGMGFFTLELARRVGPSGRVIAVDLQPRMIASLKRRAARAGLLERIDARVAEPASLKLAGLDAQVDFALAYAVVHELPDAGTFFAEVARALKPGANLLLAEPSGHVSTEYFEEELQAAERVRLHPVSYPTVRRSRAALLTKTGAQGQAGGIS
jgi:ubiquinone/menaquinone biosynthesis C-methylase UbiE